MADEPADPLAPYRPLRVLSGDDLLGLLGLLGALREAALWEACFLIASRAPESESGAVRRAADDLVARCNSRREAYMHDDPRIPAMTLVQVAALAVAPLAELQAAVRGGQGWGDYYGRRLLRGDTFEQIFPPIEPAPPGTVYGRRIGPILEAGE